MRRPRITIIPIKGGYKWRVKRYTGNLVHDNFEGIEEYPTAVLALEGCAKYMKRWEGVWAKQKVSPMKGLLKIDIDKDCRKVRKRAESRKIRFLHGHKTRGFCS